jgi:hypothetical protein
MSKGSKGRKEVPKDPEFKALSDLTQKLLKVPKSELDRRIAAERAAKGARKSS